MSTDQKPAEKAAPVVVRATQPGFYRSQRIKVGMTFTLIRASDFSKRWMEKAPAGTRDEIARKLAANAKEQPKSRSTGAELEPPATPAAANDSGDVI
jgi:hypothetical protein